MSMLPTGPSVRARIRVMRPGDTLPVLAFYEGLGRGSLRCRFHGVVHGSASVHLRALAELAELSADQAHAVVATVPTRQGERVIGHGVWRRTGAARADFGLVVSDGWQRCGIGRQLLAALITGAARQGVLALQADVLDDNVAMQGLVRPLGMGLHADPEDASLLRVCIPVQPPRPAGRLPRAAAALRRWVRDHIGAPVHGGRLA